MLEFALLSLGKYSKWLMTAIYCYNGCVFFTCSYNMFPIGNSLKVAYDLETDDIANIFIVGSSAIIACYVPFNLLIRRIGLKWGLVIGYAIAAGGAYLETYIDTSIWFVYTGYFLNKMGTLMCIVGRGPFANNWFSENDRLIALCLVQAFIYIGYGGNNALLKFYVPNDGKLKKEEIKSGVYLYLITLSIACAVASLLNLLFFRSHPKISELEEGESEELEVEPHSKQSIETSLQKYF